MTKVIRPDLNITLRRAVLIAAPVLVALMVWAINARVAPVDPIKGIPPEGKLPLWIATLACILVAVAVGVLLSLTVSNLKRWRVVLHPNRGRILGAAILSFLTPGVIFSYVPWILGPALISFLSAGMLLVMLIFPLVMLPWYLISCLLISGVRHRILRVALFCLTWWGTYGALLLYLGYKRFTL